jgi:spore maturation protein CgeB
MRIVIFGLTVSSSWGNGHATLWRSLIRALDAAGHVVTFYERDVSYYASHRDLPVLHGHAQLRLYATWDDIAREADAAIAGADCAIVTSYCPDGRAASAAVLTAPRTTRVFYDLDTPVTLARLSEGHDVPYLPPGGLADFDLVLSFTGGHSISCVAGSAHVTSQRCTVASIRITTVPSTRSRSGRPPARTSAPGRKTARPRSRRCSSSLRAASTRKRS